MRRFVAAVLFLMCGCSAPVSTPDGGGGGGGGGGALLADGQTCSVNSDCQSGHCNQATDGLRCGPEVSCGTCEAAGANGCVKVAEGTACGAASCSAGSRTASTCDSSGACTSATESCNGYSCDGSSCRTSCAAATDCEAGFFCDSAQHCVPKLALGTACTTASDCGSGTCEATQTGRVCASQSCGACQVAASDGASCVNALVDTDPKSDCAADVANCRADACDGAGSCRAPQGTSCGVAACSGAQISTFSCDAAGSCASTSTPCANGYSCADATACRTSCAADTDCAGTHFCNGTTCVPRQSSGASCTRPEMCASNSCQSSQTGMICGNAGLTCTTCRVLNSGGTACVNATSGTDPKSECTADPATCKQSDCNGAGSCNVPANTACGAGSCSGSTLSAPLCSSSGQCTNANPIACAGGYACANATSCGTSCADDTQCASTHYCSGTTCVAKAGVGTVCTSNNACASGNCAQAQTGMRCATTGLSCNTCQVVSTAGTACVNATSGTDPKNECTADVPGCQQNNCNGAGTCNAPANTACGTSSCSGNTLSTPSCSSGGVCNGTLNTSCPSGNLCADSTSCRTSCADDTQCASTHYCAPNSTCIAKFNLGGSCTSDSQCNSGNCLAAQTGMRCASSGLTCGLCRVVNATGSSCINATSGTDPKSECVADAPNCQSDNCNGTGACNAATNSVCGTSSCSGTSISTPVCSSTGTCNASTPLACPNGYACAADGINCRTSCTVDTDCNTSTHYCQGTVCTFKKSNGSICTSSSQCQNDNCLQSQNDMRCAAAGLTCGTCRVVSSTGGLCTSAIANTDPKNECTADAANCTQANCNGGGSCSVPAGTVCGSATCSGSTVSTPTCNGGCTGTSNQACPNRYVCETGTACYTSCTSDAQCTATSFCDLSSNSCQAKRSNGVVCTAANQCTSGNCLQGQNDMRCSSLTSCPLCQVIATNGTSCTLATGGTDPKGECAQDVPTCQGDNCSGAGNCLAPERTSCGATTCATGQETIKECAANGTCQSIAAPCANSGSCGTNTCAAACGSDLDCPSLTYCDPNGSCMPKHANGTVCLPAEANRCTSGNCVRAQDDYRCASVTTCGMCQVVSNAGTTCVNATAFTDPKNECTASSVNSDCRSDNCNGSGTCSPTGVVWYSCADSYYQSRNYCNADGTVGSFVSACNGYTCSGNSTSGSCRTSCTSSAQCWPNYFCSSQGKCI